MQTTHDDDVQAASEPARGMAAEPEYRNGFRLPPRNAASITPELVEQWPEDDPSDAMMETMRTTPEIDDDVLTAARDLASRQNTTAGKIISDIVRKALMQPSSAHQTPADQASWKNGALVLPRRGGGLLLNSSRNWQTRGTDAVRGLCDVNALIASGN